MKQPIKPPTFWQIIFHFKCLYEKHGEIFMAGYKHGWLCLGQSYKCRICGHKKTEIGTDIK